jgi:mono/diheme cytochrome c family protein
MEESYLTKHQRNQILLAVFVIVALVIVMQLVRFIVPEFKLDNPPVKQAVEWDSPQAEQLWKTACADCHSNETAYPAYAYVAPVGWLVALDTHQGRREINISEDNRINFREMIETVREGEMPPAIYTIMHRDADLSDADKDTLISGLRATFSITQANLSNEIDPDMENKTNTDVDLVADSIR